MKFESLLNEMDREETIPPTLEEFQERYVELDEEKIKEERERLERVISDGQVSGAQRVDDAAGKAGDAKKAADDQHDLTLAARAQGLKLLKGVVEADEARNWGALDRAKRDYERWEQRHPELKEALFRTHPEVLMGAQDAFIRFGALASLGLVK